MPKKDPEDLSDFRALFQSARPVAQDKHRFESDSPPLPRPQPSSAVEPVMQSAPFSLEIRTDVGAEEILRYNPNRSLADKLWRQLQRGDLPIEGSLDLHGMRLEEAADQVNQFLCDAQTLGARVLCVVHGKGRTKPLMKNALVQWLSHCPQVLAYCSAPPALGGAGALLIYVRRAR